MIHCRMGTQQILEIIKKTDSPLKRRLLMVALITRLLEQKGKRLPIIIGGCALSYYSREVYFTADIDLAYSDRESLDAILKSIHFERRGRYYVELRMAIEVTASVLPREDSPIETVDLGEGLHCRIIGMLLKRYLNDLDWPYLERKTVLPENDTLSELLEIKKRIGQ